MSRAVAYCLILGTVVSGCATWRGDRGALARAVIADAHSDPTTVQLALQHLGPVREPSSFWAAIANDERYPSERRRICIMQLFRRHVRAGMSLGAIAQQLHKPNWLPDSCIYEVRSFAGWIPVKTSWKDTIIHLHILPPPKPDIHGSHVYLRIAGSVTRAEVGSVLRGEPAEERVKRARLREIACVER